jgi:hypothetical protein
MRLTRLQIELQPGQPDEWSVGPVDCEQAMLLVGKNASGKSRTLAGLWLLVGILTGRRTLYKSAATWQLQFEEGSNQISYQLSCASHAVTSERLIIGGVTKLERTSDGTGKISTHDAESVTTSRFQVPPSAVAVVAKRDLLQHPYLEPLHKWASLLRYYQFGSHMGKLSLALLQKDAPAADPSDWNATIGIFQRGKAELGERFRQLVLQHLNRLGYLLEEIQLQPAPAQLVSEDPSIVGPLYGLAVKERDLSCWTDQIQMSQGMFRALALMVHLAYAELSGQQSCILLDDVGEGLDFERATGLIQLLLEISQRNQLQVLMATNDRFVMNAVPLEHWAIIRRAGGHCDVLTYQNSRAMFEDFKMTGLSNFDLLRSGYFEKAAPTPL